MTAIWIWLSLILGNGARGSLAARPALTATILKAPFIAAACWHPRPAGAG